jgi:site-specific DNA-methyltransferase (cytosine-N4-specific)
MAKDGVKVQMCVTSPPYYGLRDYGHDGQIGNEQTPQQFIDNLVEVFACVWDILADDGTLWVNLGDSYANNSSQASNNGRAGFGNPREKVVNRIGNGYKQKDLMGMPWRLAFALQDFGWYLRQDIIWHKPNPMPESVTDRCTKSHEYIFLLTKNQKYYFDHEAIKEDSVDIESTSKRYEKNFNAFNGGMETGAISRNNPVAKLEFDGKRNKRDVWTINTKSYKGAHFAVYPEELIEPCILAGSKAGDIVLDPFFGSGTTGAVAQNLGRKWIGCELNKDYEKLQNERLAQQGIQFI